MAPVTAHPRAQRRDSRQVAPVGPDQQLQLQAFTWTPVGPNATGVQGKPREVPARLMSQIKSPRDDTKQSATLILHQRRQLETHRIRIADTPAAGLLRVDAGCPSGTEREEHPRGHHPHHHTPWPWHAAATPPSVSTVDKNTRPTKTVAGHLIIPPSAGSACARLGVLPAVVGVAHTPNPW